MALVISARQGWLMAAKGEDWMGETSCNYNGRQCGAAKTAHASRCSNGENKGINMQGLHIIADLYHCPYSEYLVSAQALRRLCIEAATASGLTVLGEHFYQFDGLIGATPCDGIQTGGAQAGGATGAVVLAESHLAIHTWPERAGVTLDVYVCNVSADNSAKAENLYAQMVTRLRPTEIVVERVLRGRDRSQGFGVMVTEVAA